MDKFSRNTSPTSSINLEQNTEEKLRVSEERYHSLFSNMIDGFAFCEMIYDEDEKPLDFVYLEVNDNFEKITGLKKENVLGKRVTQAIPGTKESHPELFEIYGRVATTGKSEKFEIQFKPLNLWLSISAYCPQKGYFAAIFEDITAKKKAEETQKKLNRHLKSLAKSDQALMHATDEGTLTQEICEIIVQDCGYALVWVGIAEHNKNKTVQPVAFAGNDKEYIDKLHITWANKPRGRGPTGTVIRTGKPCVCRNMNTDPHFKPWSKEATKRKFTASLALPLSTFKGENFGALNIYSCDPDPFAAEEIDLLTELTNDVAYGIELLRLRKKSELATEVLRKQAELIDLSPDAIITKKIDGTITFWSKGAERLYGWKKEEVIGKQTQVLLKTKASVPIRKINLKLKRTGHWSGEIAHYTKEGKKIIVQSWWQGKLDKQGKIVEILESNVDVTESKKIVTKLEEYAEQMEQLANERAKQLSQAERLATIGQTAGMVGHDIRNPLQAIAGELYLTKDELYSLPDNDCKKNLQESINNIEESLYYIDKIVADLQDYTKPLRPNNEKVNVEKIIEEALLIVAIPNNLYVTISIEEGFPEFMGDSSMLKRIFMNLIQNAVQAMPNGGNLKINAYLLNKRLCFDVQDSGEGIPEEVKSKIFTPLFTTKAKGQGFGLAVVKRLVEAQKGNISFTSEKGKGTTFTIQLPIIT